MDDCYLVHSSLRHDAPVRGGSAHSTHLVTCDDVKNGKPNPEPYLKGASLLGVAAKDCIVVEDAPAGIRAGKTAGARVIACKTTSPESELIEAGADWIVEDCKSISVLRSQGTKELSLVITNEFE